MLSEKARKQRNEYIKEWRRKNPERVAEITRRYWEKKVKAAELEAAAEAKREAETSDSADCQADKLDSNIQS